MQKPTSHSIANSMPATDALPPGRSKPGRLRRFLEERMHLSSLDYPIPEHANTLPYALGGATFAGFLLLIVTGIMMTQLYNPSVGAAHQSIRYMMEQAPLAWFVRGMHHWAAQIVMMTLLLHLGRVIITGSYKKPREITFYVGLLLFLAMFTMAFTGTIVKWDQEGYEALAHTTGIATLFGPVGRFLVEGAPSTHILSRVYSVHTSILPITIALLLVLHFYLVKVLKVSPLPWKPIAEQKLTESFGRHARLLLKVGLGVTALVMVLALLFGPPFGGAPEPSETGIKPPWMFLWLYALENNFGLMGVVYGMIGLVGAVAAFPLFDRGEERHPAKRLPAMILLGVIVVALIALSLIGYFSAPVIHSQM